MACKMQLKIYKLIIKTIVQHFHEDSWRETYDFCSKSGFKTLNPRKREEFWTYVNWNASDTETSQPPAWYACASGLHIFYSSQLQTPSTIVVWLSACLPDSLWIWPAAYRFWQAPVNKLVPGISLLWALQKSRVYDYDYDSYIDYWAAYSDHQTWNILAQWEGWIWTPSEEQVKGKPTHMACFKSTSRDVDVCRMVPNCEAVASNKPARNGLVDEGGL